MQGVGAALRRTVSGCALNPQPSAGSVRWHTALASALLICASVPAMAADSAASASRSANGMIYVDSELAPASGGSSSRRASRASEPNPIYRQLSEALADYQQNWAGLPQVEIAEGAPLRPGSSGERVSLLRERLGLYPDGAYDSEVQDRVRDFQSAHGLPADGIAGRRTVEALNRGSAFYERLIETNLERARALRVPASGRYLLVDAAAAQLWMYEDGRPVDSMRVIVGKPTEQTPMLAAYVRYAVVNPYWNVPPDLVRRRVAANVLDRGVSYLRDNRYEILSGWTHDAERLDPEAVDWNAVAAGRQELRVRQLPGPGNMMGDVKFMMSDELGIYLHDTPDHSLFDAADRRLSSGCVRLEDADRLAQWLLGGAPAADPSRPEQRVDLPEPVPVFITYLTAAPTEQGIVFREDVYGRDSEVLAGLAP